MRLSNLIYQDKADVLSDSLEAISLREPIPMPTADFITLAWNRRSKMHRRYKKLAVFLAAGSMFQLQGTCLPKDYFAGVLRNTTVSIADALLGAALVPVFESLGIVQTVDDMNTDMDVEDVNDVDAGN